MGNRQHPDTDIGGSRRQLYGGSLGTVLSEESFPPVGSQSLTLGALLKCVLDKSGYVPRAFVTRLSDRSLWENGQFFPKGAIGVPRY